MYLGCSQKYWIFSVYGEGYYDAQLFLWILAIPVLAIRINTIFMYDFIMRNDHCNLIELLCAYKYVKMQIHRSIMLHIIINMESTHIRSH